MKPDSLASKREDSMHNPVLFEILQTCNACVCPRSCSSQNTHHVSMEIFRGNVQRKKCNYTRDMRSQLRWFIIIILLLMLKKI